MAREGLKFFGHISDRLSDPFSRSFFSIFVSRYKFLGGNFVLQTCRPNNSVLQSVTSFGQNEKL